MMRTPLPQGLHAVIAFLDVKALLESQAPCTRTSTAAHAHLVQHAAGRPAPALVTRPCG